MPVNVVEREQPEIAVQNRAMPPPEKPPPAAGKPLFRGLEELRSGHELGGRRHERLLYVLTALAGTGAIFGILYVSMMWFE